jgi:phosphate transport system ATP-binding protein
MNDSFHTTNPPEIEVRDLSVSYGGRAVLEDVTLTMPAGRITAIVGPSGCGKSSFLMSLNRLTDLTPGCRATGAARVGGAPIFGPAVDVVALRRRVGMIFQKPTPFPMSIRRNLELPLVEHGVPRGARGARWEQALRDVGLWDEVKDRLHRPAQSLSGGQQQRLCLARALALRPEALLLDEPCSALDPLSAGVVEALLLRLRARYTIVLVTHNLGQARRLADQVAFFWNAGPSGRLIEHGPARALFDAPREPLTAAYLQGRTG